ncbi:hypothetical protein CCAX7_56470 [Capsulimonas corticalis]|uniref:Uncharacterized protein n=1 Tax=Capsulimonas corticalis TaxID=2219043 RepID=A0A402D0N7_9BACT|nr:hypothetical protein [Capsulimonas corticalis]BDI33596.1 hypothetical protein CCAX7_56470 [Capsulimonas corticalis]
MTKKQTRLAKYRPEWQPFASPLGVIRLILIVDWDPIHVFGPPDGLDEYDSYAPGILQQLENGADVERLMDHLHFQETTNMGMATARERLRPIAQKLLYAFAQAQ